MDIFNNTFKNEKISSLHYFCSELIEIMKELKKIDYKISEPFII